MSGSGTKRSSTRLQRWKRLGIACVTSLPICLIHCVILPEPPGEVEPYATSSGISNVDANGEHASSSVTSTSEGTGSHGHSAGTEEPETSASTAADIWGAESNLSGQAETDEYPHSNSGDFSGSSGGGVDCEADYSFAEGKLPALAWEEVRLPGTYGVQAADISGTGDLWVISNIPAINPFPDFQILRRPIPEGPWIEVVGGATRVATLADSGAIVALSTLHSFRWHAPSWLEIDGSTTDLDVGANGHAWAVGTTELDGGWAVHALHEIEGSPAWHAEALPERGGLRIAVDQVGWPWVANRLGQVWRWNGENWLEIGPPGAQVTAIAIGGTGCGERAWAIVQERPEHGTTARQPRLLGWANPNGAIEEPHWLELGTDGVSARELTVDASGWPWLVEDRGRLWRSHAEE